MSDKARERLGPAGNLLQAVSFEGDVDARGFLCCDNSAESLAGRFDRGKRGAVRVRFWRLMRTGRSVVLSAEVRERASDEKPIAVQPLMTIEYRTLHNYFRLLRAQQMLDSHTRRGRKSAGALLLEQLDRERERLGRDLHTGVGQALSAIKVHLEIVQRKAGDLPQEAQVSLDRIALLADQAHDEVRSVSRALHPPEWQKVPLEEALRKLWDTSGIEQKFQGTLVLEPLDREPSHPVRLAVYRVAQETLANAVRHSGASAIGLSLRGDDGKLVLSVEDNGRGFDAGDLPAGKGIGLRTIRDLVRNVQGELSIVSDSNGTKLKVSVPLEFE